MAQKSPKVVSVQTTSLILNAENVDFDEINKHFRIIKYYPRKTIFHQKTYYQQLHNLIKKQTNYPVYINRYHEALYLCIPPTAIPPQLCDTSNVIMRQENFSYQDVRDLHILSKVAIARFFMSDDLLRKKDRKASKGSAKFLLATGKASKEGRFYDVLEITALHNWRQAEKNEFFLADKLTGLLEQGADYLKQIVGGDGKFYQEFFKISGDTTFEQFTPDKSVIKEMLAENDSVYALPTPKKKASADDEECSKDDDISKKWRRKIIFFQPSSELSLDRSRCHILNEFCDALVDHLQNVGIKTKRKTLQLQQVKTNTTKQNQLIVNLPINHSVVHVVDARKNQVVPISEVLDYFSKLLKQYFDQDKTNKPINTKNSFEREAQQSNLFNEHLPQFQLIESSQIKQGLRILFVRDYGKDAFDLNKQFAPFKNEVDPYSEQASFLKKHIPVQTININLNQADFDSLNDKDYLDYQLPSLVAPAGETKNDQTNRESELKAVYLKLFKCLNELHLKDVILHPDKVAKRLPCYQLMTGLVFVHEKKIMFNEGDKLIIMSWSDCDDVFLTQTGMSKQNFIQTLLNFRTYKKDKESAEKAKEEMMKKGYSAVVVSKECIIDIINPNERALYDSFQALKRIRDRTGKKRISEFKITSEVDSAMVDKVAKWNTFLSELPEEVDRVNYDMLVKKPTSSRKSHNGYAALGITSPKMKSEWDAFVSYQLGLDLSNPKKGITEWYKGIWFDKQNMQYIVGKRHSFEDKQEKAHELRSLVIHGNPECFDEKRFFALLDVTFINEGGYTVFPFPFKLMREWQKIQDTA